MEKKEINKMHIELLGDCIKRKTDYYLIFRDKDNTIRIAYSDENCKFKREVFDILLKKSGENGEWDKMATVKQWIIRNRGGISAGLAGGLAGGLLIILSRMR